MKLLLDEMWPPEIAEQLRRRGHDAVAVAERSELRGKADSAIFSVAQRDGYCIVTENVVDFRPLAVAEIQQGRSHAGLILTSNRRFPRHDPRTPGRLVAALDAFLSMRPNNVNLEHWLSL